MKAKLLKNRKVFPSGTALIVALLVMGVLMAISLALSVLVLRESIVTREFLDAGQSYYAAESASEIGLYGVKNGLPGWQPTSDAVPIEVGDAVAELKVKNNCKAYPCFDDGYDTKSASDQPKAFYATLGLNESATIPLFVVDPNNGEPTTITGFTVEFFANFHKSDFKVQDGGGVNNLSDWDVMRWKIVGFNKDPQNFRTESISDFTAVTSDSQGADTDALKPSWFGTVECDSPDARYVGTENIKCISYDNDWNRKAREFYEYRGGGADVITHKEGYWLKDFIASHNLNYLTLTNLINPSVLRGTKDKPELTQLSYRIELFKDKAGGGMITTPAVREYADITADGYSGKSKQSVNVKIKRDSFMPVFNFSLYSTYMEKDELKTDDGKVHDETYWYGDHTNAPKQTNSATDG